MFNKIGTMELLVILVIALFVIGPEKLPGVAKSAGKLLGTARHYLKDIMADVQTEIKTVEEDLKEVETSIKDAGNVLKTPLIEPAKSKDKTEVLPENAAALEDAVMAQSETLADEESKATA